MKNFLTLYILFAIASFGQVYGETDAPTESPAPSPSPSEAPTPNPTISASPTKAPTNAPTTSKPSSSPTESPAPSPSPSEAPTPVPSVSPSSQPTPSLNAHVASNVVVTFENVGSRMNNDDIGIFETLTNEYLENTFAIFEEIREIHFDHVTVTMQSLEETRRKLVEFEGPIMYDLSITFNTLAYIRHELEPESFDFQEMLDTFFSDKSHVEELKFILSEQVNFFKVVTKVSEASDGDKSANAKLSGSAAAVLGGIIGSSVLVCIAFGFLWRRRRTSGLKIKKSISVCSTDSQDYDDENQLEPYTPYKAERIFSIDSENHEAQLHPRYAIDRRGMISPTEESIKVLSTESNIEVPKTPLCFATPSSMAGKFTMDTPNDAFAFFQNSSSRNFFTKVQDTLNWGENAIKETINGTTHVTTVKEGVVESESVSGTPTAQDGLVYQNSTISSNSSSEQTGTSKSTYPSGASSQRTDPSNIGAKFPFRKTWPSGHYISPVSSTEEC